MKLKDFRRKLIEIICIALIFTAVLETIHQISLHEKQKDVQKRLQTLEQTKQDKEKNTQGITRKESTKKSPDSNSNDVRMEDNTSMEATSSSKEKEKEIGVEKEILEEYVPYYEQNKDIIGWLKIDGMKIDYPVMQCDDDEYYLHHNFFREEDLYGSLFVKKEADVFTPGTNFIIYGHNMKDGSMFGDLDEYRKEAFYKEHAAICFDTIYEKREYDIISVFLSQVYNEEDEVFKYYQFYQAETEEEFKEFYQNIKQLSLYDTGVTAEFGDDFLTLSTCAYHVDDGRLVIVAKRRNESTIK